VIQLKDFTRQRELIKAQLQTYLKPQEAPVAKL